MNRGPLLLGFIFLYGSLFAQSADKDLVYHVNKKPYVKLLYGKWWDCVMSDVPRDSGGRSAWEFKRNGDFSWTIYIKGEEYVTMVGSFVLKSDTIYLDFNKGAAQDTLLMSSLNEREMKWQGIGRKGDPDVWVFKRVP